MGAWCCRSVVGPLRRLGDSAACGMALSEQGSQGAQRTVECPLQEDWNAVGARWEPAGQAAEGGARLRLREAHRSPTPSCQPNKQLALPLPSLQLLLAAQAHLGTKNVTAQMERYVYRRRSDGIFVINLGKTWEKLQLAARIIVAIENPQDIIAISARPYGQRGVLKFANYTGAKATVGRHTPGEAGWVEGLRAGRGRRGGAGSELEERSGQRAGGEERGGGRRAGSSAAGWLAGQHEGKCGWRGVQWSRTTVQPHEPAEAAAAAVQAGPGAALSS